MNELLLRAIDSLSAGAAYALVAAGVALALTVRKPVHLSLLAVPGVAMLIGGWVGGAAGGALSPVMLIVTASATLIVCCGIWLILDQMVDRPMRLNPPRVVLLSSAGLLLLALVVIERVTTLWPPSMSRLLPVTTSDPEVPAAHLVIVDSLDSVTWAIALGALGVVALLMTRTKIGYAMRAVGYRPQTAGLLGINIERMIATAVTIAAALAALGGLLYGVRQGHLEAATLLRPGLVTAVAAIIAGPGRPLWIVVAAMGLGAIESFVGTVWMSGAVMRVAMVVIIGLAAGLAQSAEWRGDGVTAT